MILLIASGAAATAVLGLTLLTTVTPLWRLLTAVAVAAGVAGLLGAPAAWWPLTGLAGGFPGVLLSAVWELVTIAADSQRAGLVRGRRAPPGSSW